MSTEKTKAVPKTNRRWRWLGALLGVLVTVGAVYGAYWAQVVRYHQSTDDAYVGGNVVQITPQISGTVVAIGADDTQFVKAGQPLVRLDPADAHVALDQAEAQLARTVRDVRNLYATSSQLAGNRARVDGTTLEDHPQVRDAAAAVRNAYLTLERTELEAPVAGFVARRNVQLGQRVSPGAALMAVVPLDQVWVDANFKEPQLAHMRIGQPVQVTADLYGGHVVYHGTVAGFGAGTGAAFSLLPAQNATGNWIKIVQRVPVRIALDPREIAAHPLQIGLSMKAEVDVKGGDNGARLPEVASNQPTWTSTALDTSEREADARVQAIIAANQSTSGTAPTARTSSAVVPASRLALNLPLPGAARRSH